MQKFEYNSRCYFITLITLFIHIFLHMSNKNSFFDDWYSAPDKTDVKIALIGDGATGKTSFFERMVSGHMDNYKFNKKYNATHGCNVCQIEFKIGKHSIKVHLFDTAGQEKFGMLRDSYLMGVDGIILMYDVTQKETKKNVLSKWIPEVKRILSASKTKQYVPIMVVGNKNDKADSTTVGSRECLSIRKSTLTGNYDSFNYGSINHCLMSVKADENLMKPINWLLKTVLSYILPVNVKKSNNHPNVIYC
jgi:GTP-binding nuclear protein Ran